MTLRHLQAFILGGDKLKRWTIGEVAKQRDISVRTLRYYDQINLLQPSFKDKSGKRYYSEDDLFSLEKILILKSLSLPLDDIRKLLDQLSYKQLLVSHYNYLQEQFTNLQTSISHTSTLLNMIDLEESLSWKQVSELVRNSQKNSKRWIEYFDDEDKLLLTKAVPSISNNDELTKQYISLLKRIEWCIKRNIDPESEEGLMIIQKLTELSNVTFEGDAELIDKFWEVRKLPSEETGLYPISEEVLEFVERCMTYAKSRMKVND